MRKKINNKKKLIGICLLIAISIDILVIGILIETKGSRDKQTYNANITKLTTDYNKKQNNKAAVITNESGKKEYLDGYTQEDFKITEKNDLEDKKKQDEFLNCILDNINSDNYEKIYSLFNKQYIEDFNYTLDKFKAKYNYDGDVFGEITNVYNHPFATVVTIKFTEQNTGYIDIEDFSIFNDGTITDTYISNMADINSEKEIDNVTYTVKDKYNTKLGCIYRIDIMNKSDMLLDIQDFLTKEMDSIATYEVVSDNKVLKAYPNNKFTILLKFTNVDEITSMEIRYKNLDGSIANKVFFEE